MSDEKQKGVEVPPSKIVQIAGDNELCALCEDGSVWSLWHDGLWHIVSAAHVANRKQPSKTTDEKQREVERKAWLWDQLWQANRMPDFAVVITAEAEGVWGTVACSMRQAEDLLDSLARERKP